MTDVITKVSIWGQVYPFGWGTTEWQEVVYLTQAEYDALPASKLTDGKIYKVKTTGVVPGGSTNASDVEYDNTTSGLTADNVQDAIDELKTNIEEQYEDWIWKVLLTSKKDEDSTDGTEKQYLTFTSDKTQYIKVSVIAKHEDATKNRSLTIKKNWTTILNIDVEKTWYSDNVFYIEVDAWEYGLYFSWFTSASTPRTYKYVHILSAKIEWTTL